MRLAGREHPGARHAASRPVLHDQSARRHPPEERSPSQWDTAKTFHNMVLFPRRCSLLSALSPSSCRHMMTLKVKHRAVQARCSILTPRLNLQWLISSLSSHRLRDITCPKSP
jgi:hypothetical protein